MTSAVLLLVEDDPNDIILLRRAFQKAGVRQLVRQVSDGEAAVAYLSGTGRYQDRQAHPFPCMVLLDLKLPRMNGLEVLRWLRGRKELREVPVIMITSSAEPRDREEAVQQGIEAYQVKPVSFDGLVDLATDIRDRARDFCEEGGLPCRVPDSP